jgi:hypothetical protein
MNARKGKPRKERAGGGVDEIMAMVAGVEH